MIYRGNAAIEYLAEQIHKDDPGESSHWKTHHANFSFTGTEFQGLYGFGGYRKPYKGFRLLAHNLFQAPYKRMAADSNLFQSIQETAKEIVASQNRAYDLDVLRQILTLTLLKKKMPTVLNGTCNVWVIGDGFATMTSLLLGTKTARRIVLVNLTKTLLVDLSYLKLWLGQEAYEKQVCLINSSEDIEVLENSSEILQTKILAIQASDHHLLRYLDADLVINIASMQEMDHKYIEIYFDHIRNAAKKNEVSFYCCNRIEKTLPDGTITKIDEYPWLSSDQFIVDGLCPWHQKYYTLKPPFYKPYDGSHKHKLAVFTQN